MPPSKTALGRAAESLVAAHLTRSGYILLGQNLRLGRLEVDLAAWDGSTLVVVEVKARRRGAMVDALSSVTPKKVRHLQDAALLLGQRNDTSDLRIDVVTVVGGVIDEHLVGAIDFSGR